MSQEFKHSKQRDALLSLLQSVTCHPSAEWLYVELKKTLPKISLATVYRNLGVLCENRDAIRLDVGDGMIHYDAQTFDHSHFYCTVCHSLSDIDNRETDRMDRALEEKYGVKIESHSLIFYGKCHTCCQNEAALSHQPEERSVSSEP